MKSVLLILHAFRDLVVGYLPRMRKRGGFAFIVHPRNIPDVYRKYPFLKILPIPALEWFLRHFWSVVLSEVEGMKDKNGKPVRGWIITIPLTAEQMVGNRKLTFKKIIHAAKLAEKFGANIIGLGALTASLTKGGLDLKDKIDIGITTGRAYTTKNVIDNIIKIAKELNIDLNKATVAIIGAAGGIGSACAKILAIKNNIKKFILVDLARKKDSVDKLIKEINTNNIDFKFSSVIKDIYPADIIIAATNAPDVIIGPNDLKPGAIVVNDAQPSDISPEIFEKRNDVLVIEGGIINTPGIKYHFNFGLANKEDAFCCLGEVMALSYINHKEDYAIGYLDLKLIDDISKIIDKLNFRLANFQNPTEGEIKKHKINKIKDIINK
jgi:predicted amino acid dehydrogenase